MVYRKGITLALWDNTSYARIGSGLFLRCQEALFLSDFVWNSDDIIGLDSEPFSS